MGNNPLLTFPPTFRDTKQLFVPIRLPRYDNIKTLMHFNISTIFYKNISKPNFKKIYIGQSYRSSTLTWPQKNFVKRPCKNKKKRELDPIFLVTLLKESWLVLEVYQSFLTKHFVIFFSFSKLLEKPHLKKIGTAACCFPTERHVLVECFFEIFTTIDLVLY